MTIDHGPTLAELARRIQELYERFEQIANRMETAYVTREFMQLNAELVETKMEAIKLESKNLRRDSRDDIETVAKRVDKIEDGNTWLVRLVIGTVVVALLALVITGVKAVGP